MSILLILIIIPPARRQLGELALERLERRDEPDDDDRRGDHGDHRRDGADDDGSQEVPFDRVYASRMALVEIIG